VSTKIVYTVRYGMAMGSCGILLADAVNMQYCWQTCRSAGSQDRLRKGPGAGAGPNRPLGRSGGSAAKFWREPDL
jgi:hypothetical protein